MWRPELRSQLSTSAPGQGIRSLQAVYTWAVGYSPWIGSMLPSVLGATALLTVCCASQASHRAPGDVPSFEAPGPAASEGEAGPADLRVQLEPVMLVSTARPASIETLEGHSPESLQAAVNGFGDALGTSCADLVEAPFAVTEFSLYLELNADGYVLGGSTNPPPGQTGISAVAGCVLEQARGWLFPSRQRRGRTILIIPFVVADT